MNRGCKYMSLYNGVRITNRPSMENIYRLDMGALPMIYRMQRNGLLVDRPHFESLGVSLRQQMGEITDKISESTSHTINVGSADQVADLLFNKLGIKPRHRKKTASGSRYVVDDDALSMHLGDHQVVKMVQDYRERDKLRGTYVDALYQWIGSDGRLRAELKYTRQITGRIASANPNLLSIPTRTELGRQVRNGFIAPPGKVLATVDLSQVELRVIAHESGCENMAEIFRTGGDIHSQTASKMFHLPLDKLDKMKHRSPAKNVNFGIAYGITAEGLLNQFITSGAEGWDIPKCEELIQSWFRVNPEVRTWMQVQWARARRSEMVWDMFGRIRRIPEVKSVHNKIQEEGKRYAGNFPIQSGAQGIIKLAMAEVMDVIQKYRLPLEPLLQIHDELLFEGEPGSIHDCMGWVKEIMEKAVPLLVPLESSVAVGERWGELEK